MTDRALKKVVVCIYCKATQSVLRFLDKEISKQDGSAQGSEWRSNAHDIPGGEDKLLTLAEHVDKSLIALIAQRDYV